MAANARFAYAVCPRIERNSTTRTPKLYRSESAAKRFLVREISSGSLKLEAQVTNLSTDQMRERRAGRKAQLRQERAEVAEKIKRGELHPLAYPFHLRLISNQDQGWQNPVPVRRMADHSGPKCNRSLRDLLQADGVGAMPALGMDEEIDRALEGRLGAYACYLDEDWQFDKIDADAWRRGGHEYGGGRHSSIGEIVVRAIHDVEAAFQRLHPNASCKAVADFWRSWQVQRHIADFGVHLAESDTARMLVGNHFDAAEQTERARVHTYRKLAAFAHEVLDGEVCSPPEGSVASASEQSAPVANPETRKRRRELIKTYRDKHSLRMPDLARRASTNVTAIQGMVRGERTRYGEETLARFLGVIGVRPESWNATS